MDLIVTAGERQETVRIRRTPEGFEVRVGEHVYQVDAASIRNGLMSLRLDGQHHEVAVHRQAEDQYWVSSAAGDVQVEVADPLTHMARDSRAGAGSKGRQKVAAYMPGRVVAVLVEEGAEVEAGQGVVVLEAMKMENEIQSERGGVVRKIYVQEGQAVDGGDPLFELE